MKQVSLAVTLSVQDTVKPAKLVAAVKRALAWVISNDVEGAEVLAPDTVIGNVEVKILAPQKLAGIVQVVVFASEGVTRSVAIRPLAPRAVPCLVVDYDERQARGTDVSTEDFERECLGITRTEFDKTATYVW